MTEIAVVHSASLSKMDDDRFVVVDKESGEVLDDAQGYGYRSAQKAYTAWSYKHRDHSQDIVKQQKTKQIKAWMKSHKGFIHTMDQFAFEIAKGSWGPDDKFDTKFVRKMLKDADLQPEFTPGELLKVWQKGNL